MKELENPPSLPPRPPDANKTTVGRVLVVGGSRDMRGAPLIAASGALKSGAGLVRVALPRSIQSAAEGLWEATSAGLAEDVEGELGPAAVGPLLEMAPAWDAVVVGPGLGRAAGTVEAVRTFTRDVQLPLVLDADGLFAWNERLAGLAERSAPTVITPHEGEAARLLGVPSDEVRADRRAAAVRIAKEAGAVCVLKGPATIVTDGEHWYENESGGPVLATGGTGDLLAGVLGTLLAQRAANGTDALGAAALGVHVHGRAADLCADDEFDRGLLAEDFAQWLPSAIAEWIEEGDDR